MCSYHHQNSVARGPERGKVSREHIKLSIKVTHREIKLLLQLIHGIQFVGIGILQTYVILSS